jgi:DNA polymerase-3 subunit gamma/tau
MTYQVLARKWRPRVFADLVGQGHVVRALVNALERGQLHHAYLFTGTRGVGKTTIARILAKTLNCEQGVGPHPCGVCSACREIDEGRFVDLIEVDAASRTKVDQTRELLDNVPFAPVRGRSKVYLIDEVHMFSTSSFNALLKTLEEPPEHVKFVLATTDPQKLPATVLSRCLQFNLKRLLPEQISDRFRHVLRAESIDFDETALALLARAADGSMRDGLSLLDQAIAFGGGRVGAEDTRAMLGTRSGELNLDLLDALADGDGGRLLSEVSRIAELTPDFAGVLTDLTDLLHRLALAQQVPQTLSADDPDHERLTALARRIPPEDVQLFYQVLLTGRQDLSLAPEPRTGLEMVLLRALAFRPAAGAGAGPTGGSGARQLERGQAGSTVSQSAAPRAPAGADPTPAADSQRANSQQTDSQKIGLQAGPMQHSAPARAAYPGHEPLAEGPIRAGALAVDQPLNRAASPGAAQQSAAVQHLEASVAEPAPAVSRAAVQATPLDQRARGLPAAAAETTPIRRQRAFAGELRDAEDWHCLVASMDVGGLARQLAEHCAFLSWDGKRLRLALDAARSNLRAAGAEQRLGAGLAAVLECDVSVEIECASCLAEVADASGETPALRQARHDAQRQADAEAMLHDDPLAQELQRRFGAHWMPGSMRVVD